VGAVVGVVIAQLPSALYQVRLEAGGTVTAHIADRIDRNFVRVLVGDRVRVELSPAGNGRGRIVEKLGIEGSQDLRTSNPEISLRRL
jgi:translation initiation factor IF-1